MRDQITSFARWICAHLTRDQLLEFAAIILDVLTGNRNDLPIRDGFRDEHPNYRKFSVDPLAPLREPPAAVQAPAPAADWQGLLAEHLRRTGRPLAPVCRRPGAMLPPEDAVCQHCGAPAAYLYVNDGHKCSQLRCRICRQLCQVRRHQLRGSRTARWCPYCHHALYVWKRSSVCTSYKCGNRHCPCRTANETRLNQDERRLARTARGSQFKRCYQYREYHFSPAQLQPARPTADAPVNLAAVRNHLETVGLALSYAVSFGLSARTTAQILRRIHGIRVSHQTVLNWMESAAVLAERFHQRYRGLMTDLHIAGDETYVRVADLWHYAWFIIGDLSRAIWGWNFSDNRGVVPALATLNQAIAAAPPGPDKPAIEFIADGNPSYDAAIHAYNEAAAADARKIVRRLVIGLENLDPESEQYRAYKELIERLNRTYKFHTRARSGFKNVTGAVCLTALFVVWYNYLRPHGALGGRTPIHVPELHQVRTLQGQWLKLLQLAG